MLSESHITIFACQIRQTLSETEVSGALRKLPESHQSYVNSFKKRDDRLTRLIARLLWKRFLEENSLPQSDFLEPAFGPHGKPMSQKYGLNITHSADMVLVAFSAQPSIGIDVERIRQVDIPSFTKQFSLGEIHSIMAENRPEEAFYEAWTRKESVVKASGKGLTKKLIELEVDAAGCFRDGNIVWRTQALQVPEGYKAHLAFLKQADIAYQNLDFSELI